jgi:hypothetical protein
MSSQWQNSQDQTTYPALAGWAGFTPQPANLNFANFVLTHPTVYDSGAVSFIFDGMGRTKTGTDWFDGWVDQTTMPLTGHPFRSVGELGYMPIDVWHTLRLYDHHDKDAFLEMPWVSYYPNTTNRIHRVYDFFTMVPPPSGIARGLVNINTSYTNVLAAVLNDLPVNDYWGGAIRRLTPGGAATLAAFARNQIQTILGGTIPTNVNVLTLVPWDDTATVKPALGSLNEMDRESVLRNSMGLFTTRQQLFTINLRADSFSAKYGFQDLKHGNVMSTAQAVAQIWRDPMPNASGRHPCFVRLFKILPP